MQASDKHDMGLIIQQAEISLQAISGITLTPVSISFPDNLNQKEWEIVGESLYKLDSTIKWLIGDWWAYGNHRYGSRKAWAEEQQKKYKNAYSFQTLANIANVCRAFKLPDRREVVSFEKHRELLGLAKEEQDRMLDLIEKESLSHIQIREKVNILKPEKKKQKRAEVQRVPIKNIWKDMRPPLQLTREQVDPDFNGTPVEWVDKYGHVQIRTKAQMDIDKDDDTFSAWVGAIRELQNPLSKYLAIGKLKEDNFIRWIAKARDPEKRCAEVHKLVDLIERTAHSIQWLKPLLAQGPKPVGGDGAHNEPRVKRDPAIG